MNEFKVITLRECATSVSEFTEPKHIWNHWKQHVTESPWYDADKEAFVVFALNTRLKLLGFSLVALGSLNAVTVHAREGFRPLIAAAANSCILAHNHPSGDPTPSEADIKVTRDLIRAGQLLGIDVKDHVVIGKPTGHNSGFCSMRELGYFYNLHP